MYQALYRKWRPRIFDDVVGQEPITTTLKAQVKAKKTAHAYLFTGTRGTGKTTCSKILAKAVNCPNVTDGNPCGVCEICRGVDDGTLMDVVEIDAASNNGVDNIRDLRDEANFTPAVAKMRVYIIDETHMLSTGAFNALLKIMEEPPEHVLFILATTEAHKVPATIASRCQRFDFKRIDSGVIAKRLQAVARQEEIPLQEDAALTIASLSDGGMRDALSLLDLCSARSGDITAQVVLDCAGIVGREYLFAIAEAVIGGDAAAALEIVQTLYQRSISVDKLCSELTEHFRNLMVAKSVKDLGKFVSCLPTELEKLREQAAKVGTSRILYVMNVLQEATSRLSRSSSQRMDLELCIFQMCSPQLSTDPKALLARIEQLEQTISVLRRTGLPPAVPDREQSNPPDDPGFVPQTSIEEGTPPEQQDPGCADGPQAPEEKPTARRFKPWSKVVGRLVHVNPALAGALKDSKAYEAGDLLLIETDNVLFLQLMRQNDYAKTSIREALLQETGRKFRLGPYRNETVEKEEKNPLDILSQRAMDAGIPVERVGTAEN